MPSRHLLVFSIYMGLASSASNHTVINGWVSEPSNSRGTFTILSSCITTLILCVYTAVHLNVPHHGDAEFRRWLRTTKWVILGILAPELVVFVAWRQYVSAVTLERAVKQIQTNGEILEDAISTGRYIPKDRTDTGSKPSDSIHNPWTRVHAFYANMGGFAIDLDTSDLNDQKPFTNKHTRLTLTARGVKLLAECGYLPNISEEEILDKSKTDKLGRFIALIQAIWMLLQILGRVAVKLPITLLEVNTLAHVLCALIIYLLWWKKPKLINEPTKLQGEWIGPICAYMYMSSQISGWRSQQPGILKKTWNQPELSILAFGSTDVSPTDDKTSNHHAKLIEPCSSNTPKPVPAENLAEVVGSFELRISPSNVANHNGLTTSQSHTSSEHKIFNATKSNRWALAATAIHCYPAIRSRLISRRTVHGGTTVTWQEPKTDELVVVSAGNWPDNSLLRDMSGFIMGMILWFASMAYGGVHAIAWHQDFPSKVEAWLWRASLLCIAGSGLTWIVINMLAQLFTSIKAYWKKVTWLQAHWTSLVGLGSLATVCGLSYVMARVYLVVEAFISLRSLPASAYDTPDWTQLFPHL